MREIDVWRTSDPAQKMMSAQDSCAGHSPRRRADEGLNYRGHKLMERDKLKAIRDKELQRLDEIEKKLDKRLDEAKRRLEEIDRRLQQRKRCIIQ